MADEASKELEVLKNFIKLGIENSGGEPIMEYLKDIWQCSFIFYNYVRGTKIVMGDEEKITASRKAEYPIRVKDELLGKFELCIDENKMNDFQKKALKYISDIFTLTNRERISASRVENDLKQELISDIFTGNIKSREEFAIRSKLNGWKINDNVITVIFDLDDYKQKTIDLKEYSRKIEDVKEKMFRELKRAFLDGGMTFYNSQNSDSLMFLFEHDADYLKNKDRVLKQVMQESMEEYGFTYTVGIGNKVKDIFDVPMSYREAKEAVKIGRSMFGPGMVHEYKDLELFSLLNNAVNKDILAGELMSPLRKLIEYDRENETEYYTFLKELINTNWSLTRVSENNYIHYNTAKYRLKKTEELMGLQVDTANNRFKLELAFRLYELK